MQPSEDQSPGRDELLGTRLGPCQLLALVGAGGMARVYRAHQSALDREVAVKVLPPDYATDAGFVERFEWEARATARLIHPNIITVHDAGIDTGRLYIIMDYLPESLRDRMRAGLTLDAVGRVIRETASALTYAHGQGIVHRDVKPANVLLAANGRALLSDFGIAKVLAEADERLPFPHSGRQAGTPEYMAPEQYQGGVVDARSDIYSLGIMLYEMLTGAHPFEGTSYTALAHAHIYEPVPPPSRRNPRISPAVQAVILKALEKEPAERFQDADEMAHTLDMAIAAQQPLRLSSERVSSGPLPTHRATRTGPPVAPVVLCPRCGARNASTQHFCATCGYDFAPTRPTGGRAVTSRFVSCRACHALNAPSDRFCTSCGAPLPALTQAPARTCGTCGASNPVENRYCTACGAPLGQH